MTSEHKRIGWRWAAVAILLLAVGYVAAYLKFGPRNHTPGSEGIIIRDFQSRAACQFFWPLGWVENKLIGAEVLHLRPTDKLDDDVIMDDGLLNGKKQVANGFGY